MVRASYSLIQPHDKQHSVLYKEFLKKDVSSDWLVGVQSTGTICRFGCQSREPKKDNLIFSKNLSDLLAMGLRECKGCHPLSSQVFDITMQSDIASLEMSSFPEKKERMPKVDYWLNKYHNISLPTYVRLKRINEILKRSQDNSLNTMFYNHMWTPIGCLVYCFSNKGIYLVEFSDRRLLESELLQLQKSLKVKFVKHTNKISRQLTQQLTQYFQKKRKEFSLPLILRGSEFELLVFRALKVIPYGKTMTYQDIAKIVENAKAVRAVGRANGKNCLSILIPCHRVIGKNGKLTGYGGGIDRKRYLLELEKV